MNFRRAIGGIHTNLIGKATNRKIVVFESDDWGSIRMPNLSVYNHLLRCGIPVDLSPYCMFDTLESKYDVECLLEVLSSVKNQNGNHPRFTANFVSRNPDFQRIKNSDFKEYHSLPIIREYEKFSSSDKIIDLINNGQSRGLFKPQFHGRDHVNVPLWLELLRDNGKFRTAFEFGVWGLSKDVFPKMKKSIQATYHSTDMEYIQESFLEGVLSFKEIFGFQPKSFIPNNYIFPADLMPFLKANGVELVQGMKYLLSPNNISDAVVRMRRRNGLDAFGVYQTVRNCSFEPTELGSSANDVMSQIEMAFMFRKPAIISSHRINYVSGMSIDNRDRNLRELKSLLDSIVKRWPSVEFHYSDDVFLNLE